MIMIVFPESVNGGFNVNEWIWCHAEPEFGPTIVVYSKVFVDQWFRIWVLKVRITSLYNDVIMGMIASQITCLTIVYSIVYSHRSKKTSKLHVTGLCAGNSPVQGIHRWPVNSPHKWPVTRKMFAFDDVIMSRRMASFWNSALWLLVVWCFSTTPSVATVLIEILHCFNFYLFLLYR